MLHQKLDIEYEIEEDLDTVRFIVNSSVDDTKVNEILDELGCGLYQTQKKLHVQFTKESFDYKRIPKLDRWEKIMEQCVFLLDAQKTFDLEVFSKSYLKGIFSIASVSSLTEAEKEEIQRGENVWFPTRFHPLRYEMYAKNSVILRCNDELIGWCITVPTNSQILLYDNLFLKAKYQSLGRALSLFHHALSIQLNESPFRYLTFSVHGDNDLMLRTLGKRVDSVLVDYRSVV